MSDQQNCQSRAVVMRPADHDAENLEQLIQRHNLNVVFTTVTDTDVLRVAALIAIQHVLDYRAEVLVAPHLTMADARSSREWRALAELVHVVTAAGVLGSDPDLTLP
ncbi:hypothetical protein [Nocardia sp. NBC_00416]|uniref:hypothetical protein n=1 Tax=Nocardia sp. NBC_00416 TaxID=2975991 RepID=UPI002E1E6631